MNVDPVAQNAILSKLPSIELCHERVVHNKVPYAQCDILRVIPKGRRGFLWITYDNTTPKVYFIELGRNQRGRQHGSHHRNRYDRRNGNATTHDTRTINVYGRPRQVEQISQYSLCFDEYLASSHGTLFYGTYLLPRAYSQDLSQPIFVPEQILYYRGHKQNTSLLRQQLTTMHTCLTKDIRNTSTTRNTILTFLPVMKELPTPIQQTLGEVSYPIFETHYLSLSSGTIWKKRVQLQPRRELLIRPTLQQDIYEAYTRDGSKEMGTCHIPTYKSSVMMNAIFRTIKENDNLDALEESDDEEEFEDTREEKFVDLTKECVFECEFHKSFKMWTPLRPVQQATCA